MAPLLYAAKFDPSLSLDCARVEGVGRNLAIWQPWTKGRKRRYHARDDATHVVGRRSRMRGRGRGRPFDVWFRRCVGVGCAKEETIFALLTSFLPT